MKTSLPRTQHPGRQAADGRWQRLIASLCVAVLLAGCQGETTIEQVRQAMYDQSKYEPLEASTFFADGQASRLPVKGTVARGHLRTDAHMYEGKVNGEPAKTFPVPMTAELLERGRDRYDIFCTPCHDAVGSGNGMVVRRGFRVPPSFHIDRLREAPPGHFYDVMTNGYGAMYSYASRLTPEDRWAVAAYVRALQLSQNARLDDVPAGERPNLEGSR